MEIKKLSEYDVMDFTSFHYITITTTVNKLSEVIGPPDFSCNTGEDKTNVEWERKLSDGTMFTIYDWKEYRPIKGDEPIEFHIGGFTAAGTERAKKELLKLLK